MHKFLYLAFFHQVIYIFRTVLSIIWNNISKLYIAIGISCNILLCYRLHQLQYRASNYTPTIHQMYAIKMWCNNGL